MAAQDPANADRYVEGLHTFMRRIAELGITGLSRGGIRPGLRLMFYKAHAIYYRTQDATLFVVRVLHTAQDTSQLMRED